MIENGLHRAALVALLDRVDDALVLEDQPAPFDLPSHQLGEALDHLVVNGAPDRLHQNRQEGVVGGEGQLDVELGVELVELVGRRRARHGGDDLAQPGDVVGLSPESGAPDGLRLEGLAHIDDVGRRDTKESDVQPKGALEAAASAVGDH
jgi:hypothetical protein